MPRDDQNALSVSQIKLSRSSVNAHTHAQGGRSGCACKRERDGSPTFSKKELQEDGEREILCDVKVA